MNGCVRRRLGVKKVSFAPADLTRELTGMEIGGVTVPGLPDGLPIWVDRAVAEAPSVVIGAGTVLNADDGTGEIDAVGTAIAICRMMNSNAIIPIPTYVTKRMPALPQQKRPYRWRPRLLMRMAQLGNLPSNWWAARPSSSARVCGWTPPSTPTP